MNYDSRLYKEFKNLRQAWHYFFGFSDIKDMPDIPLEWGNASEMDSLGANGYFRYTKPSIVVHPHLEGKERTLRFVMLHEMCHYAMLLRGAPIGHTQEFVDMFNSIYKSYNGDIYTISIDDFEENKIAAVPQKGTEDV